jgi:hypothetical protein
MEVFIQKRIFGPGLKILRYSIRLPFDKLRPRARRGESFDPEWFDPELTTEGLTTEGLVAGCGP